MTAVELSMYCSFTRSPSALATFPTAEMLLRLASLTRKEDNMDNILLGLLLLDFSHFSLILGGSNLFPLSMVFLSSYCYLLLILSGSKKHAGVGNNMGKLYTLGEELPDL